MQEIPYGYCHCGCGQKTSVPKASCASRGIKKGEPRKYISGHNKSCPRKELVGQRFGRLVVTDERDKFVYCVCDCGKEKRVLRSNIMQGRSRSCGCLSSEMSSARRYRHGNAREGKVTPIFTVWSGMRNRCNNPKDHKYKDYGGRGITVCERWSSFENFLADMGPRPKGLSIERKDNSLGYCPENCVWATSKEQGRNKRNNRLVTIGDRTKTVSAWIEEMGLNYSTVYSRKRNGLNIKDALLMQKGTPIKKRGPYRKRAPKSVTPSVS